MKQELIQLGNGAHALALQILGNPDDAADAVHDSYALVLQKPGLFDPGKGALRPWFLSVVRHRCIDLIRRRRPSVPVAEDLAMDDGGPEMSLQTGQQALAVHRALARLGAEQRQILVRNTEKHGPQLESGEMLQELIQ